MLGGLQREIRGGYEHTPFYASMKVKNKVGFGFGFKKLVISVIVKCLAEHLSPGNECHKDLETPD